MSRHRLGVRTPGSHPGNRGSNPRGGTKNKTSALVVGVFKIEISLDNIKILINNIKLKQQKQQGGSMQEENLTTKKSNKTWLVEKVEVSSTERIKVKISDVALAILSAFSQDIKPIYEKLQKRLELANFFPIPKIAQKEFYRPWNYFNELEDIKRIETVKHLLKVAIFAKDIKEKPQRDIYIYDNNSDQREEIDLSNIDSNVYLQLLFLRYTSTPIKPHLKQYYNFPAIVHKEIKKIEQKYSLDKLTAIDRLLKCGVVIWEVDRNTDKDTKVTLELKDTGELKQISM